MLDAGVDISHMDFTNTRIEWDWAMDVRMEMTDDDLPANVAGWMESQGTCAGSSIAGGLLGVAKTLDRLVVMNTTQLLVRRSMAVLKLQNRNAQNLPSKGRVVVRIPGTFGQKPENRQYSLRLGDLVNILVNILQVVFVTSTGLDSKSTGSAQIEQ